MAMLNPIVAIEPQSVNGVPEDDEWEEVKLAVDSGATETVIPPDSGRRRTATRCPVQKERWSTRLPMASKSPTWESVSLQESQLKDQ